MIRDVDALTGRRWDLLIVGGGIHGLFAAYDAAQRGLSTALIEADDFGSGLSFNHQRTLHGGLRALQGGHLLKTRQQIRERRTWARIAPHLIRPLPFLLGTYGWTTKSRWALRCGFKAYDWLGRQRNDDVPIELRLPHARLESKATTRRLFPGIVEQGLSGGAVWYDYQTRHPDRLTSLVGLAGRQAGASMANYLSAVAPLKIGGRITGVRAQDQLTGREIEIEAAITLLAAGSGLGDLQQQFGAGDPLPLVQATNLVIDRPAKDIALAARGRSGRMLTAVPWNGVILVGTFQSSKVVTSSAEPLRAEDIAELLADANSAFPTLQATAADVTLVHHGLTPAIVTSRGADLLPEPRVISHRRQGVDGLISLVGVKYTTARLVAAQAVDLAGHELGRSIPRCRTGIKALPHAGIADVEGRLVEVAREGRLDVPPDVIGHLTSWYGTEAPDVLRYAAARDGLDRVDPSVPVLTGEIAYAAERGSAVRLADAVLRQTPLGSMRHPGHAALSRAAAVMARLMGWSDAQIADEIAHVDARFRLAAIRASDASPVP